jgi:hypothetical protein
VLFAQTAKHTEVELGWCGTAGHFSLNDKERAYFDVNERSSMAEKPENRFRCAMFEAEDQQARRPAAT